ncbi:unnamed protein product [Schistosoma margrebowiei]|uniref:GRIP domain-containing protein n=1 Tax=Schistosoma margrebowiei TaxID=48269 RepID=A0AA84ZXT1_9TREM|nr:unnamed protein product [Schistosoma margrebowiei]
MDWLGGLSSIKGQLTNITKDLLAEGTREINDPESELSTARTRICELESVVETQKTEINSLRCRNEELVVQLESLQLRLDHTKELFIQQLREKDILISKLQAEVSNERGEPEGQPEASVGTTSCRIDNSATISGLTQYPDLASEDHQVPSTVSHSDGTVTWEELKNEVVQLRAELTKWKKVAKKKEKSSDNTSSHQLLNIELENQIEQLKRQVSDLQETHRNEIAAVQESHSDHLSNLVEQLKETETEVIKLQKQVDEFQDRSSCVVNLNQTDLGNITFKTDKSVCTDVSDLTMFVESQENSKKSRPGKKKKKKPTTQWDATDIAKSSKSISCEMSSQTDYSQMKDSSVQSADQVETNDAFTEDYLYQSSSSTSVQTDSLIQSLSKELQTDSPYENATTSIPTTSVEIQFSSTDCENAHHLGDIDDASSNNYHLICSNEAQQTQSSLHNVFSKSHEINELVNQLTNGINTYHRVIFDMLNRNGVESSQIMSALSQSILFSQSNYETNNDVLEKLKFLINNIQFHHECITKNDVQKTVNMSLSVPVSNTRLSGEISDSTEVELDAWQDDDFPELNSNASEETKCQSELPTDNIPNCNEKLQDELPSSPHSLKEKIQQLEEMLSNNSIANANRIAELESQLEPFNRLQKSLNTTVSDLLSLPPPPTLPSHLLSQQSSCTWPPTSVEDQLALLTASEVSARNEIIRLNDSLSLFKEKCKRLECDNQQLYDQLAHCEKNLKSSNSTGNLQISDDFVELSSLAYQICVSLDPEFSEKEWNPDDWEIELFTLLKDRLDSELTETDDQSESVVKLSAEVAALRDILAQHTTFRTQAERDLKHLLFTIQNQHDMIEKLQMEKQQLESVLPGMESKLTPITTTFVTTASAATSTDPPVISTASTSTSTTTDDVANDDTEHKFKASCIDTETQTSPFTDNSIDEMNKRKENYEQYCKELVKYICSIYNDHLVNSSQNCETFIVSPDSFELTNISKVFSLLEKFSVKFNEYKTNSDNFQSMYSTLVNSLQQKHAESQLYHERLQHSLNELNEVRKHREEAEILVNSLREQLNVKQMEADNIVKQSLLMNETISASTKFVDQSSKMNFEEETSNEEKLIAEIQRLQAHLVEMEESYTSEAVIAEIREVELRSRLNEVEKSLAQLKDSCTTTDTQLQTAYSERDDALKHLEASRREVLDLKESLKTLQTVLDNFQRNQEATLLAETEHLRAELNRTIQKEMATKQEMEQLNKSIIKYQELANELNQMKNVNQQLREQILRLETKVKNRDTENNGLRDRLAKMAVDTDARIDKVLIKNLLLSYLQLPANQRSSAIRVIGSLLEFSDEDYVKIGNESGTLPKLMKWVRTTVSNLPSGPPKDVLLSSNNNDKTFTELLLAFLEEESSPRSPIKLPMDYYTPDMVSSTNNSRKQVNTSGTEDEKYPVSKIITGSTSLSNPPKSDNDSNLLDHKPVFYML